ncbi:energy-coupling factor transporter transmembrane component T family protein [Periweissella ghanensis]|uniref:Energy-coupling factor transporter transmembrane protein EcfT n=1 Tax=Periweissella ghanensis TaxID=467997 RepID=A0ABM8ZA80_9LACO|nr:energy-coupling factor transporter transmembrane protein EcfT [Periweissella ghanensis]MCM0600537.1 energy-coupling factor transporter transmembrane protein EcfT [Periweissella ghanensis]CAH0418253.1 Energy-coupling factor transporter transmembrane protein EcfT [Periweissella ghanensis]
MSNMIIGRYVPGNSIIHRLDPRAKLILSVSFIILIFLANSWLGYLILGLFTLLAVASTKISLAIYLKGLKPVLWLIVFTIILQLFFSPAGHVYLAFGPFMITNTGIINAVYVFLRFLFIILMSTVLTLTTQPLALADALEYLMKPLLKVKFPVYELSLMLAIALRFVPTLMDETVKVMNAQRARGVDFASGSIVKRSKAIVPILIPLFVGAIQRAIDLGDAMEARGYQGGENRTKYRVLAWHRRDSLAVLIFIGVLVVLIATRFLI